MNRNLTKLRLKRGKLAWLAYAAKTEKERRRAARQRDKLSEKIEAIEKKV